MKYSEETLQFWTTPLSKTEEERVDNTINMIKGAIKGYDKLNSLSIEVVLCQDLVQVKMRFSSS